MALEDFLGTREVKESTTGRERDGHHVTISVRVSCAEHRFPKMTYHPRHGAEPERLEGRYGNGDLVTVTRRTDGAGIDCEITRGDAGGEQGSGTEIGSWTADDPGFPGGGG